MMENLINELLGAFRSQHIPWKSNHEVVESIVADISQAELCHGEHCGCQVGIYHKHDGEKRYHLRVADAQRQKDMEDLKTAMENSLRDIQAVEDARREYRLKGATANRGTAIDRAIDALDEGWEVLDRARKKLRIGTDKDEYEDGDGRD